MTSSARFNNQLTRDAEDIFYILQNILSGARCSYSVMHKALHTGFGEAGLCFIGGLLVICR